MRRLDREIVDRLRARAGASNSMPAARRPRRRRAAPSRGNRPRSARRSRDRRAPAPAPRPAARAGNRPPAARVALARHAWRQGRQRRESSSPPARGSARGAHRPCRKSPADDAPTRASSAKSPAAMVSRRGGRARSRPNPSSVSTGGSGAVGARRRRPAHRDDAPQHLDEEAGEREVRPFRIGGGVDQDEPALALLFGGDQRRAVGEPRPGLAGEVERRLGQHLARHGDVGRQSARRRGSSRRTARAAPASPRTGRRPACARRAAASPAEDRRRLVGEMRPGEAQQRAAILHPFHERALLARRPQAPRRAATSTAMSPLSSVVDSPWRTSLKGPAPCRDSRRPSTAAGAALRRAATMPTGRRRQRSSSSSAAPAERLALDRDSLARLRSSVGIGSRADALAAPARSRHGRGQAGARHRRGAHDRPGRAAAASARRTARSDPCRRDRPAASRRGSAIGVVGHDRKRPALLQAARRNRRAAPSSMPSLSQTTVRRRARDRACRSRSSAARGRPARARGQRVGRGARVGGPQQRQSLRRGRSPRGGAVSSSTMLAAFALGLVDEARRARRGARPNAAPPPSHHRPRARAGRCRRCAPRD